MAGRKILMVALVTTLSYGWLGASWVFPSDPPPAGAELESVAVRVYLTEGALPSDDPHSAVWDSAAPSEFK